MRREIALVLTVLFAVALGTDDCSATPLYRLTEADNKLFASNKVVIAMAIDNPAEQLVLANRWILYANRYVSALAWRFYVSGDDIDAAMEFASDLLSVKPATLFTSRTDFRRSIEVFVMKKSTKCASWVWPYLTLQDKEVHTFLVRSVHSMITRRENAALAAWLAENRASFHVVRDNPRLHDAPIVPQLWGSNRQLLSALAPRLVEEASAFSQQSGWPTPPREEAFLRRDLWPRVRAHVIAHDAYFCSRNNTDQAGPSVLPGRYGHALPFPVRRRGWEYVGRVESRYRTDVFDGWYAVRDTPEPSACQLPQTLPPKPYFSRQCRVLPYDGVGYVHPPPPEPVDGERRYITFTLHGESPRYWGGARTGLKHAPVRFPGWRVRIYVPHTVRRDYVHELLKEVEEDIEIVMVKYVEGQEDDGCPPPRFWRFVHAADDPVVDRFISRDIDSDLLPRDKHAVDEWIASGLPFHRMRDHPDHFQNVMAGMFGMVRGTVLHAAEQAIEFALKVADIKDEVDRKYIGYDQFFLLHMAKPLHDVSMDHDSYHCHKLEAIPFPDRALFHHVGEVLPHRDTDKMSEHVLNRPEPAHCVRPEWKTGPALDMGQKKKEASRSYEEADAAWRRFITSKSPPEGYETAEWPEEALPAVVDENDVDVDEEEDEGQPANAVSGHADAASPVGGGEPEGEEEVEEAAEDAREGEEEDGEGDASSVPAMFGGRKDDADDAEL